MALNDFLQGVANAIRVKKGTTAPIPANNFADEILSIRTGGGGSSSVGLFSPNIAINEDTLTIGDKNGNFANGFEIYIDGVLADTVTDRTVLLTDLVETHEKDEVVKVKAISDILSNSYFSNEATWFYITEELEYTLSASGTYYSVTGIGNVTEKAVIRSNIGGIPVTRIESDTLNSNNNLKIVVIPSSINYIGFRAFASCSNLKSVYIEDIALWCNVKIGDSISSPISNGADLYLNNKLVSEFVVPDTITNIKEYAFKGCTSLTSVEIGDSVTSISGSAFADCLNLKSVVIGKGITSISSLMFNNCLNLKSVVIPDSVTSIGAFAFGDCKRLENINYLGTKANWEAIQKGEDWNKKTGNYTVHCTDGDIPKSA